MFYDKNEAELYETSALFAASKSLKRLSPVSLSQFSLDDNRSEDEDLEIFDVQTEEDLINLKRYLYLALRRNGAAPNEIEYCFESKDGLRNNFVFSGVTPGHEVLIFWGYEKDHFWVYNDGSLEGYFKYIRENYEKILNMKK